MPVGKVKWFDSKKGFGFIADDKGQDIFIHFGVIEGEVFRRLYNDETVAYEPVQSPKGLTATMVRRVAPIKESHIRQIPSDQSHIYHGLRSKSGEPTPGTTWHPRKTSGNTRETLTPAHNCGGIMPS
jgi:cold shock protein